MKTTISKYVAASLIGWLLWLGYLVSTDTGAFWISLLFVPIFGVITWMAILSRNIVLQSFALFMFIAQAIGSPFLWLNRSKYGDPGFSSVGSFQFDLGEFLIIYVWVVVLYGMLVWGVRKLDAYICFKPKSFLWYASREYGTESIFPRSESKRIFDVLLVMFIGFFMIPLNMYMSTNNIGTLGLLNEPLPYRLTGIMYYTRLYLGPLLILVLFAKSSRSWILVAIILGYALLAGLSSASRSVLLISMFSTLYFAILNNQKIRVMLISILTAFLFILTGASRDYTYSNNSFMLTEAFLAALPVLLSGSVSIFDTIGGIANRFYGAQDMILAYQFVSEDAWRAMVNYFISGGRSDSIVPDLGRDLYDMNLEGTGLGVGIGTMAYLLILSHSNLLVMPIAVLGLAFLITIGNRLLDHILIKAVLFNLISHDMASGPLRIAFGGSMAFSLYSSSINNFFSLIQLFVVVIMFLQFGKKIGLKSNA